MKFLGRKSLSAFAVLPRYRVERIGFVAPLVPGKILDFQREVARRQRERVAKQSNAFPSISQIKVDGFGWAYLATLSEKGHSLGTEVR